MAEILFLRFRIFTWFGTLFLIAIVFCSCGAALNDQRAIELVRLNYKQQSSIEGAGTWLLDSVVVDEVIKLKEDSLTAYKVVAHVTGLYKLPVMENTPSGYTERFADTLQFIARKFNKVWMADEWTIIGSRHE